MVCCDVLCCAWAGVVCSRVASVGAVCLVVSMAARVGEEPGQQSNVARLLLLLLLSVAQVIAINQDELGVAGDIIFKVGREWQSGFFCAC